MTWTAVVGLVLGGGLVAAVLTSAIAAWIARSQRQADMAAEKRQETRDKREAKRSRLAPLYAAAIRGASEIVQAEARKMYRLEGDTEEELAKTLADIKKAAQARLDEVGVPLTLETGAEEFNARFTKFRSRYIRKLTAFVRPVAGLTQVDTQALNIDLDEDVADLMDIAKRHLHSLEGDV
jgi:hypothetical protein